MNKFTYSLNLKNGTNESGITKYEMAHLLSLFTNNQNHLKTQARREWISLAETAVNTNDAAHLGLLLNLLTHVYHLDADLELEILLHYYQGFYYVISEAKQEAAAEFEQVIFLAASHNKKSYGYDPFNLYSAVSQAFLERLKGRNKTFAFFNHSVPQTANVA